jgi:hypothetical protein
MGMNDLYDKLVGLSARLDVMLAKMDDVLRDVSDHESRIRQLERSRWPVANVSVLVGIASLVIAVAVAIFRD